MPDLTYKIMEFLKDRPAEFLNHKEIAKAIGENEKHVNYTIMDLRHEGHLQESEGNHRLTGTGADHFQKLYHEEQQRARDLLDRERIIAREERLDAERREYESQQLDIQHQMLKATRRSFVVLAAVAIIASVLTPILDRLLPKSVEQQPGADIHTHQEREPAQPKKDEIPRLTVPEPPADSTRADSSSVP